MQKTTVDWESQWAQFAPNFHQGKAHIDLTSYGTPKTLLLKPGPGFGDLSHPTTSLMLRFMNGVIKNETALDIGCGSGILSLAALLMGASDAYGIDIDGDALIHARENARLNQLEKFSHFSTSLPNKKKGIVFINMILSEQKSVLQQIPDLPERASLWITSGILATQKEEALIFMSQFGLLLLEEKQKGEWISLKLGRIKKN